MDFFTRPKYSAFRHLLLWAGIYGGFLLFFGYSSDNNEIVFILSTGLIIITIGTSLAFTKILIPKYLIPKNFIKFVPYSLSLLLFTILFVLTLQLVTIGFFKNTTYGDLPVLGKHYLILVILALLVVFFHSFLTIWKHSIIIAEESEKKRIAADFKLKEMELGVLKSQIHPHFLFNALNTIYGFALKQSEQTPELILKLSDLLDYILYRVDRAETPIQEEVDHIQSYLSLEEIRFSDSLQLDVNINIDQNVTIMPLTFLPFIENAFKHGVPVNDILNVSIQITSQKQKTHFQMANDVTQSTFDEGIGLTNTRKRLSLCYPNKHILDVRIEKGQFLVDLSINP